MIPACRWGRLRFPPVVLPPPARFPPKAISTVWVTIPGPIAAPHPPRIFPDVLPRETIYGAGCKLQQSSRHAPSCRPPRCDQPQPRRVACTLYTFVAFHPTFLALIGSSTSGCKLQQSSRHAPSCRPPRCAQPQSRRAVCTQKGKNPLKRSGPHELQVDGTSTQSRQDAKRPAESWFPAASNVTVVTLPCIDRFCKLNTCYRPDPKRPLRQVRSAGLRRSYENTA